MDIYSSEHDYTPEPSYSTDAQLPRGTSVTPLPFTEKRSSGNDHDYRSDDSEDDDDVDAEQNLFLFTSANAFQIARYGGFNGDVETLFYHEFKDQRRIVDSNVNILGMTHSYEIYDFNPYSESSELFSNSNNNTNAGRQPSEQGANTNARYLNQKINYFQGSSKENIPCKYRFDWKDKNIEDGTSMMQVSDSSNDAQSSKKNDNATALRKLAMNSDLDSKVLLLTSGKFLVHDYESKASPQVLFQKPHSLTCFNHRSDGSNLIALGVNKNIVQIDQRDPKRESMKISNAHESRLRDIHYNPLNRYYLISSGDDNRIRYWDIRKPSQALKVITGHSHWINSVRFNTYQQSLLLSASSDSSINLYRLPSLQATSNFLDDEEVEQQEEKDSFQNRLICKITEHDDSVVDVCWSAQSPWIFASISYDGRCMIHRVPQRLYDEILES